MTDRQKYWLSRLGNFTFRLVVPAVAAGVIWGLFKQDTGEMTWLDQVQGGAFVILVLGFTEIKDFIAKTLQQMKIDHQVSFMKNRGVGFLIIAVVLVLVQMFADKAIDFFFIAGASNVVAYGFEYMQMKYYRKIHPYEGTMMHG
jgi:hypothetical protein